MLELFWGPGMEIGKAEDGSLFEMLGSCKGKCIRSNSDIFVKDRFYNLWSRELEIIGPGSIWHTTGSGIYNKITHLTADSMLSIEIYRDGALGIDLGRIWDNTPFLIIDNFNFVGRWGKWCWKCGTACRRIGLWKDPRNGLCWSCYGI